MNKTEAKVVSLNVGGYLQKLVLRRQSWFLSEDHCGIIYLLLVLLLLVLSTQSLPVNNLILALPVPLLLLVKTRRECVCWMANRRKSREGKI